MTQTSMCSLSSTLAECEFLTAIGSYHFVSYYMIEEKGRKTLERRSDVVIKCICTRKPPGFNGSSDAFETTMDHQMA